MEGRGPAGEQKAFINTNLPSLPPEVATGCSSPSLCNRQCAEGVLGSLCPPWPCCMFLNSSGKVEATQSTLLQQAPERVCPSPWYPTETPSPFTVLAILDSPASCEVAQPVPGSRPVTGPRCGSVVFNGMIHHVMCV